MYFKGIFNQIEEVSFCLSLLRIFIRMDVGFLSNAFLYRDGHMVNDFALLDYIICIFIKFIPFCKRFLSQ